METARGGSRNTCPLLTIDEDRYYLSVLYADQPGLQVPVRPVLGGIRRAPHPITIIRACSNSKVLDERTCMSIEALPARLSKPFGQADVSLGRRTCTLVRSRTPEETERARIDKSETNLAQVRKRSETQNTVFVVC